MKIWRAELILNINMEEEYVTYFIFDEQKEDFKVNEKFNEWIHWGGWISTKIPMSMRIDRSFGVIRVVQGFDHELAKEELDMLEKNMRKLMVKQLEQDRVDMIDQYSRKIQAVIDGR